jgi:hypothetical protein
MAMQALKTLADIVRSKNAGPYRITFDILFRDKARYEAVRETGAVNPAAVAAAYGLPLSAISSFFEVDMANAIKITIKRPCAQGAIGDGDMYGCQHHVPLMELPIPVS